MGTLRNLKNWLDAKIVNPRESNSIKVVDIERIKGNLFFYTWWAFKEEKDIEELNNKSEYPRNIGKSDRTEYAEPGTKARDVIFSNSKPAGKTTGKYLGMVDLVPLNHDFNNDEVFDVGVLIAEGYKFIALGAARARQSSLGLSHDMFSVLNPEDLRWKWQWRSIKHLGKTFIKIRGRIVFKKDLPPCPPTQKKDSPPSLDWARNVLRKVPGDPAFPVVGVNGIKAKFKYYFDTKEVIDSCESKTANVDGIAVDGIFEFNLPVGAIIRNIDIEDPIYKETVEFMTDYKDLVVEPKYEEQLQNIILSIDKNPEKEELLLVDLTKESFGRTTPLHTPFGTKKINILSFTSGMDKNHISMTFKIKKAQNVGAPRYYHIFFMKQSGVIIDYETLVNYYKISNIKITYKPGKDITHDFKHYSAPTYQPYYFEFAVNTKVTVDIEADFNTPVLPTSINPIFIFVSVQSREYSRTPARQRVIDSYLFKQVVSGGFETQLSNLGVLDFNIYPIILRK